MTPVKTNLVLLCLALVLPATTFVVLPRLPALHRVVPVKTSIQTSFPPSTLAIEMSTLGRAPTGKPLITNVQIDDLDQDGLQDVLACDAVLNRVVWYRQFAPSQWKELILGDFDLASPSHVRSIDLDGDQDLDLLVAVLGSVYPADEPIGKVAWLENDGKQNFTTHILLDDLRRVADV